MVSRLAQARPALRATFALAALASITALSCKSDPSPGAHGTPVAFPPLPPPPGLLAELFVPHPNASWARARDLVGGPLLFMPATYPLLVTTLLGLPPASAEDIDADVPTVGAVSSDGKSETPVLAIHVKDGGRLVAVLTQGPEARFLARVDEPSRVTLLEPKPGQTALTAAIGVTGNFLLVGYAPDGLLRLGPYAARTVASRTPPTEDLTLTSPHEALAGPLKGRAVDWWDSTKNQLQQSDHDDRERHGGSAPTFGDPGAALSKADATFGGLFALMGDLSEGRVTVTLDEAGAHARATLKPQGASGPAAAEFAALATGGCEPLLALPDAVSVAVMTRDSAEVRQRSAADQADAVEKIFGGKLAAPDRQQVSDLLGAWAKGRGDWFAAGAALAEGERAVYAESAVADAPSLDRAIRGTLELSRIPGFSEPLKHWLGELKVSPPIPLGEGDAGQLIKIERRAPSLKIEGKERKRDTERFELGWSLDKGKGTYAAAASAASGLRALTRPEEGATLGADPDIKRSLAALGNDAAFVLLVMPLRAGWQLAPRTPKTPRPASAPVVIGFGKTGSDGWLRFDAAPAAVRQLVQARALN